MYGCFLEGFFDPKFGSLHQKSFKIFHPQSSENSAIERFTKFIPSAIAPTSKITIYLSHRSPTICNRAYAVIAAPNWGDRNHPKIRALLNSINAIPVTIRMLTNSAPIGRLHLTGCSRSDSTLYNCRSFQCVSYRIISYHLTT